ncbi:LptF/LptG family permease [Baaleninema simplex]|uniref:LptF/LptG family permease n=1 Tax=Baaleninema simplex TaxID=2862350 RepID=UPI00047706C2|nr:LptF/LptG family permease [Baaleninema simplex]
MKPSSFLFGRFLPGLSIMDRYLIGETLPPFLFGVGAFSSIGVAVGIVFELVRQLTNANISLDVAAKVFVLQLPYYISLSFPMAMLLGTLIGYSRLSSDSELVALRSCGVSLYRIVRPALLLALVVTAITFAFDQVVVPGALYEAEVTLDRALKEEDTLLAKRNTLYPEIGKLPQARDAEDETLVRLFYAEKFDKEDERMYGVIVLDRSEPKFDRLVFADSATWNPEDNIWDFFGVTSYAIPPDGSYVNIAKFDRHRYPLPRAPLELARERDYPQMNVTQAFDRLEILKASGREDKIRKLEIRIQQKFAIPFACVAFGLVGAALGTKPQRTSASRGFGISVLVIFTYYLLMSVGDALGLSGLIRPWIAGWLPTLVGLGVGMGLLMRASKL